MDDETTGKIKLPPIGQIGLVVNNVDEVVQFYSSVFGIGPWRIAELDSQVEVRGETRQWKRRLAFAQLGPVELELQQTLAGKSIGSEFLDKGREGVNHLGFFVSGEEKEHLINELAKMEIGILQSGRSPRHGGSNSYLDTARIGGLLFELINRVPFKI